jgi:prephenate dehydratase
MRIAFQGEEGAFSHEACLRFAPDAQPEPLPSFEAVVEAAGAGADAMLPVENTLAGPVEAVTVLLAGAGLRQIGRFTMPIRMMLIGLPGAELRELRTVASHPVALKQCRRVIAELGLKAEPVFDTAGAVRLLARQGDRSRAALASRAAAERWSLPVLRADVHDQAGNATTFLRLRA